MPATVTSGHVVNDFVNSDSGQVNIGDHFHGESIVTESLITGNTFSKDICVLTISRSSLTRFCCLAKQ
jgi:hypothetical protein